MADSHDPIIRAEELTQEAGAILERIRLSEIVSPYGSITVTGSYFLNTMVYPDIDLYIPSVSIPQLFDIGAQLAGSDLVFQVVIEKSNEPLLPGGLYLKPRIRFGDWGRPWKIDIWSIDQALMKRQMAPMRRFKQIMTEDQRELILRYKLSVLTAEQRTPMGSGYFIYKAVLEEGLKDFDQVTAYLIANGISVT